MYRACVVNNRIKRYSKNRIDGTIDHIGSWMSFQSFLAMQPRVLYSIKKDRLEVRRAC